MSMFKDTFCLSVFYLRRKYVTIIGHNIISLY